MPSPTVLFASTTASTIQAAWDSLQTKNPLTPVTIEVLAGTYAEQLVLANQPYAHMITIQGDTRTAAGSRFTTTGSITKSGSDCTITLVNTPPADFTSSDHIIVCAPTSAANAGRFPIVSINTVAKTVTYTNASGVAESVRPNTEVIFCPDRILDFTGFDTGVKCLSSANGGALVSGFTIVSSPAALSHGVHVIGQAELRMARCVVWNVHDVGFRTTDGGLLNAESSCSAIKCNVGFYAAKNSCINGYNAYAADCLQAGYGAALGGQASVTGAISTSNLYGYQAWAGGVLFAPSGTASYNQIGFFAQENSTLSANNAIARNNATGYRAEWHGMITAYGTAANNSGNTTNYSPAPSGTEANNGGIIAFS
jgi:hypothetical protein